MLREFLGGALLLCAPAHGLAPRLATPRCAGTRAVSMRMMMESMRSELCILLPSDPFPGEAPPIMGGEMQLAELEDSCESRTQIFLRPDGTVALGQTDGPPPVSTCGLWQCGSLEFQMVLQRTFATERFSDYTVTRVYRGVVNEGSTGIKVVEGQMGFHSDAMEDEQAPAIAGAGGLFDDDDGLGGASALGIFFIDGNTLAELEPGELGREEASQDAPAEEAAADAPSKEEAKRAWLAKLDAPAWGAAASAMSQVASQASQVQTLTENCASGVEQACDSLSLEEEAKLEWMQKLDAPSWGAAAAAVSAVASEVQSSSAVSEEAAKSAWLAGASGERTGGAILTDDKAKQAWLMRLDAPTWGQAAAAISQVAAEASSFAAREEACDEGDDMACESLSTEDAAKRAWLAKVDAPSWGAAAMAVAEVAGVVAPVAAPATAGRQPLPEQAPAANEIAKQAWRVEYQEMRGVNWGDHMVY